MLESRIGHAKQALGDHQSAIAHLTKAIKIEDSPQDRIRRAASYTVTNQFPLAIRDAQLALKMELAPTMTIREHVTAQQIISYCYTKEHQWQMALRHAEAALALMDDAQYEADLIQLAETNVDNLRQMATQ